MKRHDLMMLICCLVPILVIGVLLYVFDLKNYLILLVMLLCPIMHYFMMRDMHKGHAEQGKNTSCH